MANDGFRSGWWVRGGHLQTLWPVLVRRRVAISTRRERLETPDGDFLDIDWVGDTGPIVIVLHGLEGSAESSYARGLLREIVRRGWRGALLHFRGRSGEPNRRPRSYHSGETGDVGFVVEQLSHRERETPLAAVGYSLGGNVLLKWLGEQGPDAPVKAAVAVSVPFELDKSADRVAQGFSQLYQWHLLRSLRRSVREKMQRMSLGLPLAQRDLSGLRTFRQFDDRVTAPLHGFRGADDYYTRSSSRQWVGRIAVPTLLLQAQNDPFMPPEVIPRPDELSPTVRLEVSRDGGHVGFVGGRWPWAPVYWLERRIPEFLGEHVLGT